MSFVGSAIPQETRPHPDHPTALNTPRLSLALPRRLLSCGGWFHSGFKLSHTTFVWKTLRPRTLQITNGSLKPIMSVFRRSLRHPRARTTTWTLEVGLEGRNAGPMSGVFRTKIGSSHDDPWSKSRVPRMAS